MARFKEGNTTQDMLLAVNLRSQLIRGTIEHSLNDIISNRMDLSALDSRFQNDNTGAPAYNPRILLKIVLFGYSRGLYSSRLIAEACRTNVLFMVLAEFQEPDFTTIAAFISGLGEEATSIFGQILRFCSEKKLIGGEVLAVDGCKISSNAAKEWSGSISDLENKKRKFEFRAKELMRRHEETDRKEEKQRLENASTRLKRKAHKISKFLENADPKEGSRGRERQSNVTDNESAKMKGSHGMVQGYNGIALVDDRHQVIVQAEAFGNGQEHDFLIPVLEKGEKNLSEIEVIENLSGTTILADNGFHKAENLQFLEEKEINGLIPDTEYRKRDPQFKTANRHRGRLTDRTLYRRYRKGKVMPFRLEDFRFDDERNEYICPNEKILAARGIPHKTSPQGGDYLVQRYAAKKRDCDVCPIRKNCLRNEKSKHRTLSVTLKNLTPTASFSAKMKAKMDTPDARHLYSRRMEIVEPVFANITVHKRLNRFTLRTKAKVDIQWKLYCTVHNIEKLTKYGRSAS